MLFSYLAVQVDSFRLVLTLVEFVREFTLEGIVFALLFQVEAGNGFAGGLLLHAVFLDLLL